MPLDGAAVRRACRGAEVTTAHQLCRAELETVPRSRGAAAPADGRLHAGGAAVPEIAGEPDGRHRLRQHPRDRRLVDGCARPPARRWRRCSRPPPSRLPDVPFVKLNSEGVVLIYGRDERAIEAGDLLKDHLDVTVLITPPAESRRRASTEFPVVKGTIRSAKGYLGAFELTVDDYAQPAPSSRGALPSGRRATARYRAATSCSTSRAARRCSRPPICATAICAPIPAIRPRCCARC